MISDVIVAGAGPAGSTVGYELARRGYSVLILEKEHFPRDKICAGGIPNKVFRLLDLKNSNVIEECVRTVEFTFRDSQRFLLESPSPLLYTVQRGRFDHFLLQRARSAGCQVLEGQAVSGFELRRQRVFVSTSQGRYVSRVLIGADGVGGMVSRLGRFSRRRKPITTLQCEVPLDGGASERFRSRVWIGFGLVTYGYAWIFPKRDHLTVGMGASLRGQRVLLLKRAFHRLLRRLFGDREKFTIGSYPISLYGQRRTLVHGPVLLVGEAGSLVHPVTAEGIYYAIKSASMAAEAVDDFLSGRTEDLISYQRRVDGEIGSFFHKSRIFSGLFYGLPGLSFRLFVNDNRYLHRYLGDQAVMDQPMAQEGRG